MQTPTNNTHTYIDTHTHKINRLKSIRLKRAEKYFRKKPKNELKSVFKAERHTEHIQTHKLTHNLEVQACHR